MKKILILMLAMLTASATLYAADPVEKAINQAIKAKKKELKKGGWELFGTSQTLDMVLYDYYDKLLRTGGNYTEQMGNGDNSANKTLLHQKTLVDAARSYAQKTSSQVEGMVTDELKSIDKMEVEDFNSMFSSKIQQSIGGQLQEKYSVIRESKNNPGYYEMQTYFLVDESKAQQVRKEAMQAVLEKTKFGQGTRESLVNAAGAPVK